MHGGNVRGNKWRVLIGGLVLGTTMAFPILAADEPAPPPETTTDASDPTKGFVTFKSGDNSLTLGAWGQFRVTIDDKDEYDADTAGSGVGTADGTSVAFSVHKIRPYLLGTVFKPWLKYKFEFELGPLKTDATSNVNNARLTDAYVEFAKFPAATLRVGQYKVPFGLQELTPDTKQEFVDRSIVNAKFTPSRDIGLMLLGYAWERKFGYQVGLFNGAGQNNPQEDQKEMYAARVWIDPLGEYKMFEAANDASDKNVLHIGLAYRGGEVMRGTATAGVFEDADNETAASFEIAWRWSRLFAMGEYFVQEDEQVNPAAGPDVKAQGFHVQVGVMVQPKQHELALRYAQLEPDKDVVDAEQTEMRLVYGYYIKGHNLKIQTDIGQIAFGENFSTLSALALRNVSPALDATKRLVLLPGTELKDNQCRIQVTVNF
jgi:phosphate-selective porin OprO/OprP